MRSDHRLLSALAALILLLGLMLVGGCSQEQPDCPEQTPCPDCPPCPELDCPEPLPELKGRLRAIKKRGVLIAGVRDDAIPFGYTDEHTGEIVGFEIDICRALAQALGVRLETLPVRKSARIPLIQRGEVDIIAATMTHHFAREDDIDFSITYFMDGQKLLTKRGSGVHSVTDLAGRRVGVVDGSWAEANIREAQPGSKIKTYPGYPQAFMDLKARRLSAICADTTILLGLKNSDPDPAAWEIVGDFISDEPYGLGVPEDDSNFRDFVNLTLNKLWVSGEYMKIYNLWFGPHTKFYLPTAWRMEILPGNGAVSPKRKKLN
ncbi:ABC transporter substrate-binding protein [Desulfovibrio ferrophilus]|uniref:ABC-type transporter, periplasmic subunit family 3 n=1 Tax=Desulfovibrio ferrophilus TaxID=241368 RepID=A0A2Z6AUN4_9BACT|nr:ABC transporter substrate-binding protein [Desulfovibrio ferrophilus]BBD06905.1 ABC-type transporter, periplasmic subunit family 3 [Desulfovibrio ferrophilus]